MVLSAALVLAWQGAATPLVEPAPPPSTPVVASPATAPSTTRRPVWVSASLGALHGGAIAYFIAARIVVDQCDETSSIDGPDCFSKNRALSITGELAPFVTTIALGTGTGLLGRHDAHHGRAPDLWRFRIAGAVLCGAGAVLGGAAFSALPETEFSVLGLRLAGRTLWTTGLPLLTYAFGYRHALLARMRVAPVVDPQRVGVVLSGRF